MDTASSPRRLRVFLVENNEDTRFLMTLLIEQMGHEVASAASVHQAIDDLSADHWDVLISDIGLPDGTGWDLVERLGVNRPVAAIAMSGYGMASDRQRSLDAGFRAHLIKPVEPSNIEAMLADISKEVA